MNEPVKIKSSDRRPEINKRFEDTIANTINAVLRLWDDYGFQHVVTSEEASSTGTASKCAGAITLRGVHTMMVLIMFTNSFPFYFSFLSIFYNVKLSEIVAVKS